jgi:hypothetical protein
VLVEVSPEQRTLVLRGMWTVATAAGTEAPSDADRAALVAANTFVFRNTDALDPDELAPITPAELAAATDDAGLADHVAQFLTVMATIDGTVDDAKIATVESFAAALGVHADYLRQLAALAQRNLQWLRVDVQRQNLRSITGHELDVSIDAWIVPYRDHPDPALVARHETLGALPVGTFGRTFFEFYRENGFAFAGDPAGVNAQFATPHDSTHVLSGYDTTPQGELLVSTFTAGMHPHEPMSGHILPVIMTWHMGIELVHFAGKFSGGLDPEKFWVAWDRGSDVTTDVFALDWDFWAHVEKPLEELRAEYSVPVLDPRYAAHGDVLDWYRPSA